MNIFESFCTRMLMLGWGRSTEQVTNLISHEVSTIKEHLSFVSFHYSISASSLLTFANVHSPLAKENIRISLPSPGIAYADSAQLALDSSRKSSELSHNLANLCLAGSLVASAKASSAWAAQNPISYLSWHIINHIKSFKSLINFQYQLITYVSESSFLVWRASDAVFQDTFDLMSAAISACEFAEYLGDTSDIIHEWNRNGYDIV